MLKKASAKKAGSFTIEVTLLMSFIIGVLVFIIYMAFYTHDRVVLTKCAYIAALRGSQIQTGDEDVESLTKEQAELLPVGRLLGKWELENTVTVAMQEVSVSYIGYLQIPGGLLIDYVLQRDGWGVKVECDAKRVDEVDYIRRIRLMR